MSTKVEIIKPYGDTPGDKTDQVRRMFDSIAPAYDFMNRAMTLGVDRLWRKKAIKAVAAANPGAVLDVACGTGDMILALAKVMPDTHITGLDLSPKMLEICREKVDKLKLGNRVNLSIGDSLDIPFPDSSFDYITVAYGVRNFSNLSKGYSEFYRVLKAGGGLCVVELSTPKGAITKPIYDLYTRHIIPLIGRRVSKDKSAYSYLPDSIAAVPQGNEMAKLIAEAGFTGEHYRGLTFGACTIYMATKPTGEK